MPKKAYNVKLRRRDTGAEETRLVLSDDPESAAMHAIRRAKSELKPMADREYAQFEVLSCVAAPATS